MPPDWLILHAGALGDLVLTIQAALRTEDIRSSSRLHVASRADIGDLSDRVPSISRRSLEGLSAHWLYSEQCQDAPARLRDLVYDRRVLSALGDTGSVVHRRLASLRPARLLSFDPHLRDGWHAHITEQWLYDLRPQGVNSAAQGFNPCPHRLDSAATDEPVGGAIAIHPGSGGPDKCWPLGCFLDVARRLRERGREVRVVVGPVELERWPEADLEAIRREAPLVVSRDADRHLELVCAAKVWIGNDAGPAHLAALVGTPTVTVFGPTSARIWRPLGRAARVFSGDPQASPNDWNIDPAEVAACC